MSLINKSTLVFLKELQKNNDRDWFKTNKKQYEQALENIIDFAQVLLEKLQTHDQLKTESGKKSLFRIYRDVRFSKDKSPFKTHFSGSFTRANKFLRGGYYFHIQPGASFVGGGFWEPNPEDLKRIRQDIYANPDEIDRIIKEKNFVKHFKNIEGEKIKTFPRGFNKEDSQNELLKYKQFLLIKNFTDKEVLSENFAEQLNEAFKAMRPFFNYMSEVITTHANGEPLV
jgi:uncharacterized protein (TIGR02453 family)